MTESFGFFPIVSRAGEEPLWSARR